MQEVEHTLSDLRENRRRASNPGAPDSGDTTVSSRTERRSSVRETDSVVFARDDMGTLKTINQYSVVKPLGEGAFSEVYLVRSAGENGDLFAAKVMYKSLLRRRRTFGRRGKVSTALDHAEKEIAIMKKLEHPCLVKLYEVIDDPESDLLVMVMEYMEKGTVMDWDDEEERFTRPGGEGGDNGPMDERTAAHTLKSVVHGIAYLHHHHVAHRDLKPDNILVSGIGNVKISDFGVSHFFNEEEGLPQRPLRTLLRQESRGQLAKTDGTWAFWAPEMCSPSSGGHFSAYGCDMWAVGVCLWAFVFGTLPFVASGVQDLFDKISSAEALDFPPTASEELKGLLEGLLCKDVQARFSVPEVLAHPWMVQYCGQPAGVPAAGDARAQVTEDEVAMAFSPINRIIVITKFQAQFRRRLSAARERISERKKAGAGHGEKVLPAEQVDTAAAAAAAAEPPAGALQEEGSDKRPAGERPDKEGGETSSRGCCCS